MGLKKFCMLFYKGGNTLESQVEQNKNVCKLDIYLMMKYHKFNDIIFNDDVLEAFPLLSEKILVWLPQIQIFNTVYKISAKKGKK